MEKTSLTRFSFRTKQSIFVDWALHIVKSKISVLSVAFSMMLFCFFASTAFAQTQSLKLYYVHTHEKAEIVFKRDGRYDKDGLKKLNYFLRDWRRNEPTNMDPRLFDLIWTVYELSGSKDYIHVLSAYRSPATNNMLRSKSKNSGVAKSSQHVLGHAMDFYLPDVDLKKLRAISMKQEVGGVGYYPKSGSPFVHLDIGGVRHWPRMSRKELMALFPDGKTMYIPTDGKVLPGYAQAKADFKARNGAPIMMASLEDSSDKKGGFFSNLFGRKSKQEDNQQIIVAQTPNALPPQVMAEAPTISALDLPEDDAPLPIPSPLMQNDSEYGQEDEEDFAPIPADPNAIAKANITPAENNAQNNSQNGNSETSLAVAYANIPVPQLKPETLPPETLPFEVKNIASVPIPTPQPQLAGQPIAEISQQQLPKPQLEQSMQNSPSDLDEIAPLIASTKREQPTANSKNENIVAAVTPPTQNKTLQEKALEIDTSDSSLASLIASNRYITIPDDDEYYDEEEDYADIADQEENNENVVLEENKINNAAVQNTIPFTADKELLKIPDVIYVSGLIKQDESSEKQELHGRAVEFKPIVRIN